MNIEVLDLSGVGSGWNIDDYSRAEKNQMEKENTFYRFKTDKELIDFAELQSAISCDDDEFNNVNEAVEYLEDMMFSVKR